MNSCSNSNSEQLVTVHTEYIHDDLDWLKRDDLEDIIMDFQKILRPPEPSQLKEINIDIDETIELLFHEYSLELFKAYDEGVCLCYFRF